MSPPACNVRFSTASTSNHNLGWRWRERSSNRSEWSYECEWCRSTLGLFRKEEWKGGRGRGSKGALCLSPASTVAAPDSREEDCAGLLAPPRVERGEPQLLRPPGAELGPTSCLPAFQRLGPGRPQPAAGSCRRSAPAASCHPSAPRCSCFVAHACQAAMVAVELKEPRPGAGIKKAELTRPGAQMTLVALVPEAGASMAVVRRRLPAAGPLAGQLCPTMLSPSPACRKAKPAAWHPASPPALLPAPRLLCCRPQLKWTNPEGKSKVLRPGEMEVAALQELPLAAQAPGAARHAGSALPRWPPRQHLPAGGSRRQPLASAIRSPSCAAPSAACVVPQGD